MGQSIAAIPLEKSQKFIMTLKRFISIMVTLKIINESEMCK